MTDTKNSAPVAAYTIDHTGCDHISRDIAGIELIAASGAHGPTEVVYLFAGLPAPQDHAKPLGHISAHGFQKLQTRNHYCVSVSYAAEKEYNIPIYAGLPSPQDHVMAKSEAFDRIIAARKKHVDAVATYNARLKFVSEERQRGTRGLNVDPEFRAMSDAQWDYIQIVQELADAALAAAPAAHALPTNPLHRGGRDGGGV